MIYKLLLVPKWVRIELYDLGMGEKIWINDVIVVVCLL